MDEALRSAYIACVRSEVSPRTLYTHLGQELGELIADVLKYTQYFTDDDPTPCSPKRVQERITEELSDVCLYLAVVGLEADNEYMDSKLERWVKRLDGEEIPNDARDT